MSKVSVVIPTYNNGQYICQAIDSILAQTYTDYEIIVVDDGSTDDTRNRLEPYFDQIRYIYQENQERSVARNIGIKQATGKYIAFLDADDYWLEQYLEKQISNLEAHPHYGMSRTWVYDVDIDGKIYRVGGKGASNATSHEDLVKAILVANCFSSIAVVVRADCFDTAGLFDPQFRQAEDWDMWLRIALRYPVGTVHEPLACYRHNNAYMPERIYRRGGHQAFVQIVKKTFAQIKEHPLYSLKPQALSRAYLQSAWINYAVDNVVEGRSQLNLAYEVYPDFFSSPYEKFVDRIAIFADELYDLCTPLEEGLAHIDQFFSQLPDQLHFLRRSHRQVKGQYCGLNLFRSHNQHDSKAVLHAAVYAIRNKPGWFANRGFLSITAQALLATKSVTSR